MSARRRLPKALRVSGIATLAVLLALAGSTVANALLERAERTPQQYGHRVEVGDGHLNVLDQPGTGPAIVMLGGYGTPAPGLDFAPLIRALAGHRTVVVEGFGYGYSDTTAPPRTIANMTRELHTALDTLAVPRPYVLLGHSIAGLTMLAYTNAYPDEVSAVIGIDASVPGQLNGLAGGRSPLEQFARASGLLRVASTIAPGLTEPPTDSFTTSEKQQIRLMTDWTFADPALVDEAARAEANFAAVAGMRYPVGLPVLSFIKTRGNQAGWRELHLAQLSGRDHGELVELDGGHYLHWTKSPELARSIEGFLATAVQERVP